VVAKKQASQQVNNTPLVLISNQNITTANRLQTTLLIWDIQTTGVWIQWNGMVVEWTGMVEWNVDNLDGFSPPCNDHL